MPNSDLPRPPPDSFPNAPPSSHLDTTPSAHIQRPSPDGECPKTLLEFLFFLSQRHVSILPKSDLQVNKDPIGDGTDLLVFPGDLCRDGKTTLVAIKQMRQDGSRSIDWGKELLMGFYSEIYTLSHPSIKTHRNIVGLLGVTFDDFATSISPNEFPKLVLERAEMDLSHAFDSDQSPSNMLGDISVKYRLIADVADGLAVLHAHDIVHCDLSPKNILIFQSEDGLIAKLSDFGSIELKASKDEWRSYTILFGSPQIGSKSNVVTSLDDVYSFGLVSAWIGLDGKGETPFERHLSWDAIVSLKSSDEACQHLLGRLKNHCSPCQKDQYEKLLALVNTTVRYSLEHRRTSLEHIRTELFPSYSGELQLCRYPNPITPIRRLWRPRHLSTHETQATTLWSSLGDFFPSWRNALGLNLPESLKLKVISHVSAMRQELNDPSDLELAAMLFQLMLSTSFIGRFDSSVARRTLEFYDKSLHSHYNTRGVASAAQEQAEYVQRYARQFEIGDVRDSSPPIFQHLRQGSSTSTIMRHFDPANPIAFFSGWTALHYAIYHDQPEIVRLLSKSMELIDLSRKPSGPTPLHLAVALLKVEATMLLLDGGANTNATFPVEWGDNSFSISPIFALIVQGDRVSQTEVAAELEILKLLRRNGASSYGRIYHGCSLAHVVADSLQRLRPIFELDVEFFRTARDANSRTVLYLAVLGGFASNVEYLLSKGCNPSDANTEGYTPLHIAFGLLRVAKNSSGTDFAQPWFDGAASTVGAAPPTVQTSEKIIMMLCEKGADLEAATGAGEWTTPEYMLNGKTDTSVTLDFTRLELPKKGLWHHSEKMNLLVLKNLQSGHSQSIQESGYKLFPGLFTLSVLLGRLDCKNNECEISVTVSGSSQNTFRPSAWSGRVDWKEFHPSASFVNNTVKFRRLSEICPNSNYLYPVNIGTFMTKRMSSIIVTLNWAAIQSPACGMTADWLSYFKVLREAEILTEANLHSAILLGTRSNTPQKIAVPADIRHMVQSSSSLRDKLSFSRR